MDDEALLRYSRHVLLDEIGIEGQQRIGRTRVLQVGAGGLGSTAALFLAAAGVARLVLVDDDRVELTNLQRQVIHPSARLGELKSESAAASLRALNPAVCIEPRAERATPASLPALLQGIDLVLDCSDNLATRHALNRACLAARLPLVSGAASGFSGQLAVFDFRRLDAPCYACLFPEGRGADDACAVTGVFAPLVGVLGAMQAGEALKLAAGEAAPAPHPLLLVDGRSWEVCAVHHARLTACAVCGTTPA